VSVTSGYPRKQNQTSVYMEYFVSDHRIYPIICDTYIHLMSVCVCVCVRARAQACVQGVIVFPSAMHCILDWHIIKN
jgi:hypothetical protein